MDNAWEYEFPQGSLNQEVKISTHQQCRSNEGWQPIKVQSGSDPLKFYLILGNTWGPYEDFICECYGYIYRGRCKHQDEAHARICGWSESEGPEFQSDRWRKEMTCPRCTSSTVWVVQVEEDED